MRRWRLRTSFKFFATAAAASGFYEALQLGLSVARATARGQMALLISALISWLPLLVLWFVGWYGTWWVVLRTGWVNVPSSLIAAGLHCSVTLPFALLMEFLGGGSWAFVVPMGLLFDLHTTGLNFIWMIPVGFFVGWSLMFLPGTIAAFEFVPAAEGKSIAAKRVIAWIAPGIVAFTVVILASSLWEPAEMRWFSV